MINRESISNLLKNLEGENENFKKALESIIKAGVKIVNSTEELREELIGFDDIYQTSVIDLGFNYWLQVSEGKLSYKKGINPEASFIMNYTKELIIKILKGEISGTDAFMKGRIHVQGEISQGLRYVKLFRIFTKYLEKKNGNSNHD
ncbi:MAG: SCP2 sterol-binding domain-containing protein [Candidatus Hodarchaeota archaeon]